MAEDCRFQELMAAATSGRMSRRQILKRATALGLSGSALAVLLAACGGGDEQTPETGGTTPQTGGAAASPSATSGGAASPTGEAGGAAAGEGVRGGVLKVAMIGEPPTLDIHQTSGTIVSLVAWEMYEPLFAWDDKYNLIPMLAESYDVSSDQLTNTIKLRKGVPFHNGQEMKAEDVVASIQRWATKNGLGKSLIAATDSIETPDDYTVVFKMKEPFGAFAPALALTNQGCAIYPKSILDAAGEDPLQEFVGTGPYRFVEHLPDRHILLERFEDYAALPGEPMGYGGHKYAYFDQIEYLPVTDEAARIAGVQAGDYHYVESITPDQYVTLENDPVAVAEILAPNGWGVFILNMKAGIMTDLKIRQAFQAALDLEAICEAGYGAGFYRLDPSIMLKETVWYSEAGSELYNRKDPDAARQLLQEAGYDGTPIRFYCTQQYQDHYNRAVVAKQQLEAAGFTIDLQVYDWATVLSAQQESDKWDVTTTGISFKPDPAMMVPLDVCNFAGWWCTEEAVEQVGILRSESDFEKRYAALEKVQELFYTEVPEVKVGDARGVIARSRKLQGLSQQTQLGPILWNTWLEE